MEQYTHQERGFIVTAYLTNVTNYLLSNKLLMKTELFFSFIIKLQPIQIMALLSGPTQE